MRGRSTRVLAVGDRPTVMAAYLARLLGLPGHPPEAAAAARDKRLTREKLKAAGLPTPSFITVPVGADADRRCSIASTFPVVVKPTVLSGSRGVIRADDAAELRDGVRSRAAAAGVARGARAARSGSGRRADRGVHPGAEYALEGLLEHGVLRTLAIFDKPDPLDGPFFEETIYVTPSRARAGDPAADRRRGRGGGARRSACITVRFTPSAASTPRRLRARSRGAADRRPVREGAALRARPGGVDRLRGVPAASRARRVDGRLDARSAARRR